MAESYEPFITVIIPTLNEEKFIARCLNALKNVDYPKEKIDIRVIDNYSEDMTPSIVSGIGVKILKVERKTIAYSRNAGAMDVQTDLLAFLDADCLPDTRWLRSAVKHFAATNIAAVGSYPSVLEKESNALQKTWAALCSKKNEGVHEVDWLPTANLIVRTSFFRRIAGFNETLITCEDVDLGYRLRLQGVLIHDPEVIVYHLREPRSFLDFIKKETWHAKNNISGTLSHGFRLSEIPSLAAPLLFGAGIISGSIGAVLSNEMLMYGLVLPLLIPVVYTIRGHKRAKNLPLVFIIYCAYFSARSYAAMREILKMTVYRT